MQELVILTTAPPWKRKEEKCMWGTWFTEMSVPPSAAQLCLDGSISLIGCLATERVKLRASGHRACSACSGVRSRCALSFTGKLGVLHRRFSGAPAVYAVVAINDVYMRTYLGGAQQLTTIARMMSANSRWSLAFCDELRRRRFCWSM